MFIILAELESGLTMNFSKSLPELGMSAHEEHLDKVSIKITSYGNGKY
jgi:hypothetical protein